jgi:hypothetical protein
MHSKLTNRRHGIALIYVTFCMVGILAICSLAIDVAHVRVVKLELQQAVDTASYAAAYTISYGSATCQYYADYAASQNKADGATVNLLASDIVYGTWDPTAKTFTPMAGWSASANAVRVTARRTAATSNAVKMTFANIVGLASEDVIVSSTAYAIPPSSQTVTINGTDDPWLAGMPAGTLASYDDHAPGQSPVQVTGINVTPGSVITFTNVSGAVDHDPSLLKDPPSGNTGQIYSHGADSPGGPTPATENGIGDILAPIDGLLGVFLTDAQPDQSNVPAPTRLDYSTASSRNQTSYSNFMLQQPFYIGSGQTSSGATQQFTVPAGATRLFLGPMDGHQWENNGGSFTATVTSTGSVQIVQ